MKIYIMLGLLLAIGMPFTHNLSGKDWGMAVKGLATSEPGAVAAHLNLAPGGMPAVHSINSKDWGNAVSSLARSYPGAVADHIHMF